MTPTRRNKLLALALVLLVADAIVSVGFALLVPLQLRAGADEPALGTRKQLAVAQLQGFAALLDAAASVWVVLHAVLGVVAFSLDAFLEVTKHVALRLQYNSIHACPFARVQSNQPIHADPFTPSQSHFSIRTSTRARDGRSEPLPPVRPHTRLRARRRPWRSRRSWCCWRCRSWGTRRRCGSRSCSRSCSSA